MKRSNLFIIGLASAVITIISLNIFVGRSYGRYHHWGDRGYCHESDHQHDKDEHKQRGDSTTNYY